MQLYIRADANSTIGTGHIMRCIALAQAWQDQGGEVTFISHCGSEALWERISKEGFQFIAVKSPHPHPDDLSITLEYLKRPSPFTLHPSPTWLVLDGYHFTPEYQKAIRDAGGRLMVIDDMNHLSYYHADILLNQNIHAPDLKYKCDTDTTLLLGTRYVLLRREFLKYWDFNRQIPDRAKKILVTLGGDEPDNVALKVVEALKLLDEPDIMVKIIVGPTNPHQETLRKAIASAYFEAEHLINPTNMPELMAWADLAISAGGSTCWELAFMGVPIMALILADNQKAVAEGISKEGFAVNLGWYKTFDEKITSGKIKTLTQSKEQRLKMVQNGQALIRASGRDRLYERILARSISIKPAKESDCELIWHWANNQEVRNSSFCSKMIPFEDHEKWFYAKLKDPQSYLFIGYDGSNRAIGQIRFDKLRDREFDVDVSIDKCFREKGYGSELIKQAIRKLLNVDAVDVIHSHVKFANSASKYVFLKAGFIREKDTIINNFVCFHLIWKR